ncbi:MAG: SecDF P1 head subdomain-containing protein [Planctomycetota bacterium]
MTGVHNRRRYVLVSDKPGQTMVPGEGKDAWGLAKAYVTADGMGRPAVGFQLDDRGAELFSALTKANVNDALAVVIDGKVISAPIIRAALGKRGMIPGRFTGHEAAALVKALRAGMPPGGGKTAPSATATQERFLKTVSPELVELAARAYAEVDRRAGLLVGSEAESARKAHGKAYYAFERKVVAAWPFGDKATKQSRREYAALSNRIWSMTRSQAVAKLIEFADAHRGQPEGHAALHRAAYLYLDRVGHNRDEPAARAMLERLAADLEFGATSFTVFAEQNLVWLRLPRNATADGRVRANSDFYLRLEGLKGLAAVVRMVFRPSEKVRPEDWASCVNGYLLNLRSAQNNTRANLVAPKPDQAAYTLQTPNPAKTLLWLRRRHAGDPVFLRAIDATLKRLTAKHGPATLPGRNAVEGPFTLNKPLDAQPRPATQPAAVPAGSKLEFRIAPKASDLGKAELASYRDWLKAGRVGFWWKGGRIASIAGRMPDHGWLPISGELSNAELVTGVHNRRRYVLVSDKPGQTMVPGEGKDAWGLAKVYVTADSMKRPAVGFELDDRGTELFAALTKANTNNALAVVVDGKVTAAPIIKAALGKTGIITGQFTAQQAAAMVKALRAGMPPGGGRDSPASSRPAVGRAATVPADAPEWVKAALAAMPGPRWEVDRFDRKPSLTVDGRQGSRLVLRRGHKQYQDLPLRQRAPYSAEELRNARFVMRYRHVELAVFPGGPLAGEAAGKLSWTEWQDEPAYFKKVVHLGEGLGLSWYAKAAIFDQERLRKALGLEGGDDRLALLTEALSIEDSGSVTRTSCTYLLGAAGDKAIPYVKAAVEKNRLKAIRVLGHIRTDAATEYLKELYRAEATRRRAEYALIHRPYRKAAKEEYLDMLRRRRYVFQAARACVEFRWKEAIRPLEAIYLRPKSTGEFEVAFRAKRTLEGRPVPAEIDNAQKELKRSAYAKAPPTREALAAAKAALVESKDTEAAAVIAIRLALYGAKASRDRVEAVRKIGREVLRGLPRRQTEEIVLRLARSLEANPSRKREARKVLKILSPEEDPPRRPPRRAPTPTERLSPSAAPPGSPAAPYPGAPPSGGRATQPAAEVAEIERLIRQLGSDKFAEREAAQKALVKIGEPALPALAAARRDANLELARGAGLAREQILKACRPPPPFYDLARSGVAKIGPDGKLPDGRFCEGGRGFIFGNAEALALYRKGKRYDGMYCKRGQADRRKAAGFYARAIEAQPYARVNAAIANRIAQMYAFNPPTDPRTAQHWWRLCAEMTGPHQVLWFQAGMGLGSAGVMTRERVGALANYQAIVDVDTARIEPPEWVFRSSRKQYDLGRESARRHMARIKTKAVEKIAYVLRRDREKTLAAMRKIAEEHKGTPAGEKAAEILGRLGENPASGPKAVVE